MIYVYQVENFEVSKEDIIFGYTSMYINIFLKKHNEMRSKMRTKNLSTIFFIIHITGKTLQKIRKKKLYLLHFQ